MLLGCVGLLLVVRALSNAPQIDAQWQSGPAGLPVLQASDDARLVPHVGRTLRRLSAGDSVIDLQVGMLTWQPLAPRWTVDDDRRTRLVALRGAVDALLREGEITLAFDDGGTVAVTPTPRGLSGLGFGFLGLAAPALLLYLVGVVVLLARPSLPNALYAVMALCQALGLLWVGIEASNRLTGVPAPFVDDLPWRLGLDLATAAAAVNAFVIYPRRVAHAGIVAAAAWAAAALTTLAAASAAWPQVWWWGQGVLIALGAAALAVLQYTYRREPHPFARVMRRFGVAALGSMLVVNAAIVAADRQPALAQEVATAAILVWSLFIASLTALVPFLSRERRLLREFAMLAGLSAVATSLDLLFVSAFSLEPFASLTLAVFIALACYAAARQWLLDQLLGSRVMDIDRLFENLYRAARELQKHPDRRADLLGGLLRDLFDPAEVLPVTQASSRTRVLANGAAMLVPVRRRPGGDAAQTQALVLRFARQGRGLFTREDARLTDRIVEQLRRAVAYDRAVERGRTEERQRIAQDLHDDIGARLLTLMYQAADPAIEDYLRQTLKDLKTLTRGLAATRHGLADAVAEWKADAQQRLEAAGVGLSWRFVCEQDVELGVVQWSGLTRVLRELLSNAIHHAHAETVDIEARVDGGELALRVADDGIGRDPAAWSQGLGLGGVRKRVRQLGGSVAWRELAPRGIVCELRVPLRAAA